MRVRSPPNIKILFSCIIISKKRGFFLKTVILKCTTCGIEFVRTSGEANRNAKLGRRPYCSRKCVGVDNWTNFPPPSSESIARIQQYAGLYKKPLSPFGYFLRKKDERNFSSISIEYLKSLWNNQNGICPITGCKLRLPQGTTKAWIFQTHTLNVQALIE